MRSKVVRFRYNNLTQACFKRTPRSVRPVPTSDGRNLFDQADGTNTTTTTRPKHCSIDVRHKTQQSYTMPAQGHPLIVCIALWGIFLLLVGYLATDDIIQARDSVATVKLKQTDSAVAPHASLRRRLQSEPNNFKAILRPQKSAISNHHGTVVRYLKEENLYLHLRRDRPASNKHLIRQLLHFVNQQKA